MVAGVSEDLLMSVDAALLHQLAPPLLRDEDTRIEAATCLARRLQSQVDSPSEAAAVVKLMCAHCASDGFLLELFLELLVSVEHKGCIIHSIALSAVDATEHQVQAILDVYRELLVQDRSFLVPIVGSISELQLTNAQRESFLLLVEGSLAVVDDTDVPTIVSALLQLTTASNAVKIMRTIRTEASHVTTPIAALLASPLIASIRARPPCARAYIAELSRTAPLTSMDVLVVVGLLQVPSVRRAAAGALFAAIHLHPPSIATLRVTLSSNVGNDPANVHLVYATLQHSITLPPSVGIASSSNRRRAPSQQLEPSLLLSTCVAVAGALICHHPALRKQVTSALLTACATRAIAESPAASSVPDEAQRVLERGNACSDKVRRVACRASDVSPTAVWDCTRIAAGTLLQIAEMDSRWLEESSDQLCQFFAQHAAVCDGYVLHLIAATIARIAAQQLARTHEGSLCKSGRGGTNVGRWSAGTDRDQDLDDRDDDLDTVPSVGSCYSNVLLLIQKLFFSLRSDLLKSSLILAGHLMRNVDLPQSDADTILRSALRLPFDASWLSARCMLLRPNPKPLEPCATSPLPSFLPPPAPLIPIPGVCMCIFPGCRRYCMP